MFDPEAADVLLMLVTGVLKLILMFMWKIRFFLKIWSSLVFMQNK